MASSELPGHVRRNIEVWTRVNAEYTDAEARRKWEQREMTWGVWNTPESAVRVLPDVAGLDVVELGCGTAYFASWLARRGARVVGVDPTPAQLETARAMQAELGIEFPLVEAAAESVPLADASFDLALSEYGASIWSDPYEWIPEAARLLRPEGRLIFMRNSTLVMLCLPDDGAAEERLVREQREMHRFEWPDGAVEFHLGHGDWIDVLRGNGFEIERLLELYAPTEAEDHGYYDFVATDWARRWPAEELWVARTRA
jgi:SAM-dependent methyltransferase